MTSRLYLLYVFMHVYFYVYNFRRALKEQKCEEQHDSATKPVSMNYFNCINSALASGGGVVPPLVGQNGYFHSIVAYLYYVALTTRATNMI